MEILEAFFNRLPPQIVWGFMGSLIILALVCLILLVMTLTRRKAKPIPAPGKPAKPSLEKPVSPPPGTRSAFQVSNLAITPSIARQGEPVSITVQVTNNTDKRGSYSPVLMINDRLVATKELNLKSGESTTCYFSVQETVPGEYRVDVEGLQGSFTIPFASFTTRNLVINPTWVKEGEEITVSVEVVNTGGVTGNYNLTMRVDGKIEAIKEVTLPPGTNTIVSFNIIGKNPGFHRVKVDNLEDKFGVEMKEFEEE